MKIIHGAFFFASSNRSLTREAPTPTNISTKSDPEMLKNGTPASPATAFAINVLPVPGGPTNRTPLGILAPTFTNLPGFLRKLTISSRSSFSSSSPATSLNVTVFPISSFFLARLFPKFIICPPDPPPWIRPIMNVMIMTIMIIMIRYGIHMPSMLSFCTSYRLYFASFT